MRQNRLLNLLAANRQRGEFKAEANTIFLYDTIVSSKSDAEWLGGVDAETFVQTLLGLEGDVALRINSPGGDVFAGRAMAKAISDYSSGTVTAYVDGCAASAACFITSAADRVVMSEGSMLMIHKAWTMGYGDSDEMSAMATLLSKIDESIALTYEAGAKRRDRSTTKDEFAVLMAAETWMTGSEAIEIGMADEIAKGGPQDAARWDMSAFGAAQVTESQADKPDAQDRFAPHQPENEIEQRPNIFSDLLLRPTA